MSTERFPYDIEFAAATHVGYMHTDAGEPNQDFASYLNAESSRYAVAALGDGLGSYPGSEHASRLAVRGFIEGVREYSVCNITPEELVRGSMIKAHDAVKQAKLYAGVPKEASTTFVGLVFDKAEGALYLPNAGDSLIAQIGNRTGDWHQLNTSHQNQYGDIAKTIDGYGPRPDYEVRRVKPLGMAYGETKRFMLASDGWEKKVYDDSIARRGERLGDAFKRLRIESTAIHKTPQQAVRDTVKMVGIYDDRRREKVWLDDTTHLLADITKK